MDSDNTNNPPTTLEAEAASVSTSTSNAHMGTTSLDQETVSFSNQEEVYSVEFETSPDNSYAMMDDSSVSFANFLSRPVEIAQGTWEAYAKQSTVYDPWTLWQADARVKHKLNNFAFLRCTLKVRIVLNGTKFHYGRLVAAYAPHYADSRQAVDATTHLTNPTVAGNREIGERYFSTYPHVVIDPSKSNSAELTLPFFWYNNALAIAGHGLVARDSPGSLVVYDLNDLRVAKASTSDTIGFTIYAWAEDVHVSVPTELVPTSLKGKTEMLNGPVSSIASVVAGISGKLANVPIIGPFARASQIGASAIGSIAKIFGYSMPPLPDVTSRTVIAMTGGFANTIGASTSNTLTFDPKQEINVDPRTVGLGSNDEMSFASIFPREQFLTHALWKHDVGQFSDSLPTIFASLVNPNQQSTALTEASNDRMFCTTPAGHIGRMFRWWRGDITYRIEVVCSQYHSGRLKLQFDPMVTFGTVVVGDIFTNDVNARHTVILDLAESCEAEMTIKYVSRYPYMQTRTDMSHANVENTFMPVNTSTDTLATLASRFNPLKDMGIFSVSILNPLVCTQSTSGPPSNTISSVDVNVYMKCSADMEFAGPAASAWTSCVLYPTSLVGRKVVAGGRDDESVSTYFGERVVSLRSLLKRKTLVFSGRNDNSTSYPNVLTMSTRRFPHFAPNVSHVATRRGCPESYIAPAYIAKRGSTRWFHRVNSGTNDSAITNTRLSLIRKSSIAEIASVGLSPMVCATANNAAIKAFFDEGFDGMTLKDLRNECNIDVQIPWYNPSRYYLACDLANTDDDASETLFNNSSTPEILFSQLVWQSINSEGQILESYFAVGDDYSLFCYVAPPLSYFPE